MKALEWIEDKFRKYDTPRLYCGGLAVKAYGGTRPLNDIDVFVPDVTFWPLVEALKDHIRKPAIRQCEAGWNLLPSTALTVRLIPSIHTDPL